MDRYFADERPQACCFLTLSGLEQDAVVTTMLVPFILSCDACSLGVGLDKVPDPGLLHQ